MHEKRGKCIENKLKIHGNICNCSKIHYLFKLGAFGNEVVLVERTNVSPLTGAID